MRRICVHFSRRGYSLSNSRPFSGKTSRTRLPGVRVHFPASQIVPNSHRDFISQCRFSCQAANLAKSRFRKGYPIAGMSLRAPARCVAISLKRTRLLRFTRRDNILNRDLGLGRQIWTANLGDLMKQISKEIITQILPCSQCIPYRCDRFIIRVIRDFRAFWEISKSSLTSKKVLWYTAISIFTIGTLWPFGLFYSRPFKSN
jgi:hypothetical protein